MIPELDDLVLSFCSAIRKTNWFSQLEEHPQSQTSNTPSFSLLTHEYNIHTCILKYYASAQHMHTHTHLSFFRIYCGVYRSFGIGGAVQVSVNLRTEGMKKNEGFLTDRVDGFCLMTGGSLLFHCFFPLWPVHWYPGILSYLIAILFCS